MLTVFLIRVWQGEVGALRVVNRRCWGILVSLHTALNWKRAKHDTAESYWEELRMALRCMVWVFFLRSLRFHHSMFWCIHNCLFSRVAYFIVMTVLHCLWYHLTLELVLASVVCSANLGYEAARHCSLPTRVELFYIDPTFSCQGHETRRGRWRN